MLNFEKWRILKIKTLFLNLNLFTRVKSSDYEEVENDFKEDEIKLHPVYMKMIERGMEDVRNGHVLTEEEIDKIDEEWLN